MPGVAFSSALIIRRFDRTRFAPAPTGYLHLGHVVNAIYVWGMAAAGGGKVLLRIEDHDRIRSRREYDAALLDDLAWLGFVPDAGPVRQSDDDRPYRDALDALRRRYHVYGCDCSRTSVARTERAVALEPAGERRYSGQCRNRGLPLEGRAVRVAFERREISFTDERLGPHVQVPAEQCGDLLVRDRDGHWTYQFAVVVDDRRYGIDFVVRGEDLLTSTGRQIQLAGMLGRSDPPRFLHHPLLLGASGRKLSKSDGAAGVRQLRADGMAPAEVIGRAAGLASLVGTGMALDAAQVGELFR
jgi:glutamyl-tRNA synthetase/glutamyl-Q tRNA(Asp) synthetase